MTNMKASRVAADVDGPYGSVAAETVNSVQLLLDGA